MVTTTHFRELRGRVGVETQGTGDAISGGGWTNLLDIGQDFASGSDYSIVVMGTMGWLDCRNTTLPSAAPFAEVAYQIGGTAGLKRSRAQMVFPTLATPRIGGQNINRAQPFMFIIRVNNYVPATPVRVVARIDPNGVIPYAQQFRFDVQCQSIAFDADELDTTALRFADYFQPLTEIPNSSDGSSNVTPIATRLALPTHPLGLPEKWLIFSEANVVTSDPGHVVEFTSRVLNQPIGDPIDTWKLRSSARAPARGASLTQDNRSRTAMGLCRVVSLEGGTSNEVEQYFHQRAPSNIDKSWWFGGGILAVRLSALQVAGHSTVARTRTNFFADDEPADGAFVVHTPPTIEPPTGPGPQTDLRPAALRAAGFEHAVSIRGGCWFSNRSPRDSPRHWRVGDRHAGRLPGVPRQERGVDLWSWRGSRAEPIRGVHSWTTAGRVSLPRIPQHRRPAWRAHGRRQPVGGRLASLRWVTASGPRRWRRQQGPDPLHAGRSNSWSPADSAYRAGQTATAV